MNIKEIKDNWLKMDKSSFTESIELEYQEDDPLYLKMKQLAEENEMETSEFINMMLYTWIKEDMEKSENKS
jgi:hypothetical protein